MTSSGSGSHADGPNGPNGPNSTAPNAIWFGEPPLEEDHERMSLKLLLKQIEEYSTGVAANEDFNRRYFLPAKARYQSKCQVINTYVQ